VGRDVLRGFFRTPAVLPLADDIVQENVVNLDADTRSILNLYKALIALRKQLRAGRGSYMPIVADGDLLLYRREHDGEPSSSRSISARSRFHHIEMIVLRRRNPAVDLYGPEPRHSWHGWICAAMKAW